MSLVDPLNIKIKPFDLAATERRNKTHMGNLHGCPTNIEHTGEKTIVKYFKIPGVIAEFTEQTILKNKKKTKHN